MSGLTKVYHIILLLICWQNRCFCSDNDDSMLIDWSEEDKSTTFYFTCSDNPSGQNNRSEAIKTGYRSHENTTTVNVALYIESISSFKAQTMDFEVDMYLAMSWYDHRLVHNSTKPVLIIAPETAEKMWHPDLYFVNSKTAAFQTVTTPNFMVLVYSDGYVFKSLRLDVLLACMMKLNNFPMDEQECPIWLQSYAYIMDVVNLTWFVHKKHNFPISYNPLIELNDMYITGQSYMSANYIYPMFRGKGYWSYIICYIKMKRYIVYHILQTYVPTTMLVFISWLSFWMDMRAAPARVALAITTLLTLVSVSNGARTDLPQVSYIKAIDVWLTVCTAFVFCVLLEYSIVSHFLGKSASTALCVHKRNNNEIGFAIRQSYKKNHCEICAFRREMLARKTDNVSKLLFPLSFLAFVIIYVPVYTLGS